jgi:hypothetical protein
MGASLGLDSNFMSTPEHSVPLPVSGTGVVFEEAKARAVTTAVDGVRLVFLGKEDLGANQAATG